MEEETGPSNSAKRALLEHRIKIYENLSKDSLTILTIQLLVISISVSLAPQNPKGNANNEIISQISMLLSNKMTIYAGLCASISIVTAIFCYYRAKRMAHMFPNLFLRIEDELSESTISSISRSEYVDDDSLLSHFYNEYREETSYLRLSENRLTDEFDASHTKEHQIRSLLTFSIVLTITSVVLFVLSLTQDAFVLVEYLVVLYLILAIIAYYTLKILAHYLALIEKARDVGGRILFFIIDKTLDNIFPVSATIVSKIESIIGRTGMLVYLLVTPYILNSQPYLVPISLFIGLYSVLWYLVGHFT